MPENEQVETTTGDGGDAGGEVEQLRAQLKRVNAESAERRKKLEAYEAADRERADAAMPELERTRKERDDSTAEVVRLKAENESLRIRHSVISAAANLGFQNPEDAFELADLSQVEIDGDKVSGYEKSLEALAKSGRLPMNETQAAGGHGTPKRATTQPNARVEAEPTNFSL